MRNLFSSINRYAHRQHENFLTESLAYLLDLMRTREPTLLPGFLEVICGQELAIDADNLVISTQESTDVGRPDLVLTQKLDFTIFVEIKDQSGPGPLQLERYRTKLLERESRYRQLVFLTRSKYSMRQSLLEKEKYHHVCWYQISAWLSQNKLKDEVTKYISESYETFLEDKNMSLMKVTREFTLGVVAMRHLLNMMEIALLEVLPEEPLTKTDPWDSIGFYWKESKNWLGIYYAEPQQVWLEKGGTEKPRPKLGLNLTEIAFFDMDGGQQLECLINFLDQGIKELNIRTIQPI